MADCEKINDCRFFSDKMANMPSNSALMKEEYCRGDKSGSARYQVGAKGIIGSGVPLSQPA